MTRKLVFQVAQLNPVVGDISGNAELALQSLTRAEAAGADLLVLPELMLIGYPPEDLVRKPAALDACEAAISRLAAATTETRAAMLIGSPWREGGKLYNSALLLEGGEILFRYDKRELPNYGVFDEVRLFEPGEGRPSCVDFRGVRLGIAICEDIWLQRVPQALADDGADIIVAPNASPWRRTVREERHTTFSAWRKTGLPYLFVNQVGGQDELVFDGASYAVDNDGHERQLLPDFETGEATATFDADAGRFSGVPRSALSEGLEAEYRAAVLGLGDYVDKNGFPGVLLGLSGGIDSALTAAIAVDALGPERVWAIMLPSKYTSEESLEDAAACARALGIRYDSVIHCTGRRCAG